MGTMTTATAIQETVVCPVCGGGTEVWVHSRAGARGTSVDAYRCQACNSVSSWPVAVPDGLYDALYQHS